MVDRAEPPVTLTRFTHSGAAQGWRVDNGRGDFAAGTHGFDAPRPCEGLLVLSPEAGGGPLVVVTHCLVAFAHAGRRWRVGRGGVTLAGLAGTQRPAPDHVESMGASLQWTWKLDGLMVRLGIWMPPGEPTSYLRIEVLRSNATVMVTLSPWIAATAYPDHAWSRIQGGYRLGHRDAAGCSVIADAAVFRPSDSAADIVLATEDASAQTPAVRAWLPGWFDAELAAGEALALVCSMQRVTEPAALAWARACAWRGDVARQVERAQSISAE